MPRVPWDDINKRYKSNRIDEKKELEKKSVEIKPKEFNLMQDLTDVSRLVAFGVICGGMTGAAFGAVDVLKDTKAMTGKSDIAKYKMIKFTSSFAGFFGGYHGVRKILNLYSAQPPQTNAVIAAAVSITPLLVVGSLRPLLPYGIMLIALDAINGVDDM